MDDAMLKELLNEIDTMTSEEYQELFDESQKLLDLLPVPDFWQEWDSVAITRLVNSFAVFDNTYLLTDKDSNRSENKDLINYSETEENLCLAA